MKIFSSLQKIYDFFIEYTYVDSYGRPSFVEKPPIYNKTYNKSAFPSTIDEVNSVLKKYLSEESSELIRYNLRNLDDLEVLNLGSIHIMSDIESKFAKSKKLLNDIDVLKKRVFFNLKNLDLCYCQTDNYEKFTVDTRPKSYWIVKSPTTSSEVARYLLRFKEKTVFNEDYVRYRVRKLMHETKLLRANHVKTLKKISIDRNFQMLFNDLTYMENTYNDQLLGLT